MQALEELRRQDIGTPCNRGLIDCALSRLRCALFMVRQRRMDRSDLARVRTSNSHAPNLPSRSTCSENCGSAGKSPGPACGCEFSVDFARAGGTGIREQPSWP